MNRFELSFARSGLPVAASQPMHDPRNARGVIALHFSTPSSDSLADRLIQGIPRQCARRAENNVGWGANRAVGRCKSRGRSVGTGRAIPGCLWDQFAKLIHFALVFDFQVRACRPMSKRFTILSELPNPSQRSRQHDYEGTSSIPAGRSPPPCHILGDAGLADIDAELEKLAMDSRCSPQWIEDAHLADQPANLQQHRCRPKTGAVPADHVSGRTQVHHTSWERASVIGDDRRKPCAQYHLAMISFDPFRRFLATIENLRCCSRDTSNTH
jgi:hypothetical protein